MTEAAGKTIRWATTESMAQDLAHGTPREGGAYKRPSKGALVPPETLATWASAGAQASVSDSPARKSQLGIEIHQFPCSSTPAATAKPLSARGPSFRISMQQAYCPPRDF